MNAQTFFCIYCGKQFERNGTAMPKYCLYCGKELVIPGRDIPADDPPAENVAQKESEPLDAGGFVRFDRGETAPLQSNADFVSSDHVRIFTGWLPEGFSGSAKYEPRYETPEFPMLLWGYAQNGSGASMFCRREKVYYINKLTPEGAGVFRPFDRYLDENAAAILGTNAIRLLKRVPAFPESEQKLYETLMQRKQQIESQSQGNLAQCIVQGEYGAEGGKLYEAAIGGKKQYLLLYTVMLADEFGVFSPLLIQSQQRTNQLLQSMQFRGRMPFMQMPVQQTMPVIDTDPNTPFGFHRTDGLTSNSITWLIPVFAGYQTDTVPDKAALRDFFRFLNSLKTAPETEQQIGQLREQLMMQRMMDEQQAANIMGQMIQDQQRSFDRRSEIMRDLNEHRDTVFQQRLAADNAAFDRRSRLQHESIMGVNTYTRTDGTTVEADIRYDRVFQREHDPSLLAGAPNTAEIPFGWTELDRLK